MESEVYDNNNSDENIIKFKNIYINEITFLDNTIYCDNKLFNIQTPIFKKYERLYCEEKIYLKLFINSNKSSHIKFLNFIDSIELLLKNNNKQFNSKIIKDKNYISIMINISNDNKIFDNLKNEISNFPRKSIILLINFQIYNDYYNIICNQILEI